MNTPLIVSIITATFLISNVQAQHTPYSGQEGAISSRYPQTK